MFSWHTTAFAKVVMLICLAGFGTAIKLTCLKTKIQSGKLTSHNLGDVPCDRRIEGKSCSVPCKTGFVADEGRSQAINITCERIEKRPQWTGWRTCVAQKSSSTTLAPTMQSISTSSLPASSTTTTTIECPTDWWINFQSGHIQNSRCTNTNPSDTCELTCELGYKISGSNIQTITCEDDGRWSVPTRCSRIECPPHTSLDLGGKHMEIAPDSQCGTKYTGETCDVRCEMGYGGLSAANKEIHCALADDNINGKWVGYEDSTCQRLPCPPLNLGHGADKPMTVGLCSSDYGSECTLRCKDGYKFADNDVFKKRVCSQRAGVHVPFWSGNNGRCTRIECLRHTSLNLGARHLVLAPDTPCGTKYITETCEVQCETGYGGLSPLKRNIRCAIAEDNINGKWVGYESLTCTRLSCGSLNLLLRRESDPTIVGTCSRDYGSECTLRCKSGYKFVDGDVEKKRICSSRNGIASWSGNEGRCRKIDCPSHTSLRLSSKHLIVSPTSRCGRKYINETCAVQCKRGYGGLSPYKKYMKCELAENKISGKWVGYEHLTCQQLRCRSLSYSRQVNPPVITGYCGNAQNSVCTVKCRDGYGFADGKREADVRCSLKGEDHNPTWSNPGLCRRMACDTAQFNRAHRRSHMDTSECENTQFESSCSLRCVRGYKFPNGLRDKTFQCISGATGAVAWQPSPSGIRECEGITCPEIVIGSPPPNSLKPTVSCPSRKFDSLCTLSCPEGYVFKNGGNKKTIRCDEATEKWEPAVNDQGFCTIKVVGDGNCEYWFSGDEASRKDAQSECKKIFGSKSALAMPNTKQVKDYAGLRKRYYVGGNISNGNAFWDDGNVIESYTWRQGNCVYLYYGRLYLGTCTYTRRYMCERPAVAYDPCEQDGCQSGGTCIPLGCSYICKCRQDFYGNRCQKGPFNISIDAQDSVPRGTSVTIKYRVTSNAGQAKFELYVNGENKANLDDIGEAEKSGKYKSERLTNNIYITGKVFLKTQPDIPTYKCKKVSVEGGDKQVNIANDVCDGTTFQIEWKGLGTESTSTIPYDIFLDEKKYGTSESKSHSIIELTPATDYNIKVVPHLEGCRKPDLFESYTKRTTRGPPDASNITLPAVNMENLNCTFAWTNERLKSIGGFTIIVTEKVRSFPGSLVIQTTQTPFEKDFNNDILEYSHPTKPNSLYEVAVGTKPLSLCQEVSIKWTKAIGCQTDFAPPDKASIIMPARPNTKGKSVFIEIGAVDERNGQVSCYLVVVQKVNETASGNLTTEPTTDLNKLAQANETIGDKIAFISLALARFEGNATHNLGDGRMTCCDMSNSSVPCGQEKTGKRKRATGENVIRGENRQLDPDANYRHYVIVSTPTENGKPALVAGTLSEPWSPPESDEAAESIALLVVLPIVLLILLVMLVVGVIMYKRKRAENKVQPVSPGQQLLPLHRRQNQEEPIDIDLIGENPDAIVERALRSHSFQLANLFQIMEDKRANENMLFLEEFKEDIMGAVKQCSLTSDIATLPANENKNRYRNIVPYDSSRVVLKKIPGDEFSEYINAAYIDGYKFPKKFIATQGPQAQTIPDFWRMIWEQGSCVIAVLTRMVEKRKIKCAQYWPEDEDVPSGYDNISVILIETTTYGDYLRRKLAVSKDGETRTIFQFHFIAWPDHGIPDTTSSIFRFHKAVMNSQSSSAGPIVVHCSAGVGRTGTFIALDILSEQMFETEELNICVVIANMRTSRTEMVQTMDQYIYIHKLVLELYQFGETDVDVSGFNAAYNNLKRVTGERSEIEQEFERLDYFLPLVTEQISGRKQANKQFNRDPSVLPYDHKGVIIQMNPTDKSVPYYNASVIAAYQTTNIFVVAQTPEEKTVEMFWRTVLDNNVSMIVALCQKNEAANYCYWPKRTESVKYGSVSVRTFEEATDMGCVERKLELTRKDKKVTITQIFYGQWSERIAPASCGIVLDMIARVEKHHQTLTNTENKTTLVHCSDGSGRSGTFCAISNLIERLKNENRVDVFRTVKDLRDQRPMMVRSLGQYEFCYQAVSEFLQSFDLYGNFQ